MTYNMIVIPDIHWGAIDPDLQLKSLEFIFITIEKCFEYDIPIDLIVIAGDYFDSKLPLNSREALLSIQWFNRLYDFSLEMGVRRIRMFQGTLDHDNDQLEVFKPLVARNIGTDMEDFFKIFMKTTLEETLPNLKCLYCPDETIVTRDYELQYVNEILAIKDIGFFHGSFDVVYGELLKSKPDLLEKKNVIFRYDLFNKSIKGPMISGHWHDGKQYDDLYYTGSPFRWQFNEDETKGISFISYNTDDSSYYYEKIGNPLASEYMTYQVFTIQYQTKEDYKNLIEAITQELNRLDEAKYLDNKLRIMIYVVDDKPINDVFISSLRQNFINNRNVKIVIKNKLKDKMKKEESKKIKHQQNEYGFIYDKNDPSEIIHDFIMKNGAEIEVPIAFIKDKVDLYYKQ